MKKLIVGILLTAMFAIAASAEDYTSMSSET